MEFIRYLAERDKDDKLNEEEFIIAQFLVDRCKKTGKVPEVLPNELIESVKNTSPKKKKKSSKNIVVDEVVESSDSTPSKDVNQSKAESQVKTTKSRHKSVKSKEKWVISSSEKRAYLQIFDEKNINGFIDGKTAVAIFTKSKLPREDLAEIWNLSDMDKDSQLSKQEFFIAMHLITKRVNGIKLPSTLPVELVYSASGIKKSKSTISKRKSSRSSVSLIPNKPEHAFTASDPSLKTTTNIVHSSSGVELPHIGTLSKRSSMMFTGSLSSYGIDEAAIPEYDSQADISKVESIQDLDVALAFAKQLDEDISNLTLLTEKQKLQVESLQDKLSFREEQIQMIEKRKEAFTSLLNSYSADCKEEEEHLRNLQNEIKTLLSEIEEKQKLFKSPAAELQSLRDRKKKLQSEYNAIKQEYDKDKIEYQRLVLEIEKLKAEQPDSNLDFAIDSNWADYDFTEDNNQTFEGFSSNFDSFDFQTPKFEMAFESGTMTPVYSEFMEPQEEFNFEWVSQSGLQTPSEPVSFDDFFTETKKKEKSSPPTKASSNPIKEKKKVLSSKSLKEKRKKKLMY